MCCIKIKEVLLCLKRKYHSYANSCDALQLINKSISYYIEKKFEWQQKWYTFSLVHDFFVVFLQLGKWNVHSKWEWRMYNVNQSQGWKQSVAYKFLRWAFMILLYLQMKNNTTSNLGPVRRWNKLDWPVHPINSHCASGFMRLKAPTLQHCLMCVPTINTKRIASLGTTQNLANQ